MSHYSQTEKEILLKTASDAIVYGLKHHEKMPINSAAYPDNLRQKLASFVTLNLNGQLRGCIGSLIARQPLIEDVAANAYNAAFSDPRFPAVTNQEFLHLSIHISVLSAPEPVSFTSESDLISKIRPNIDGLILTDKGRCGTFLPSVWDTLHTAEEFWQHLKLKAGLPIDHWSDTLQVERYTTEMIE